MIAKYVYSFLMVIELEKDTEMLNELYNNNDIHFNSIVFFYISHVFNI